MKVEDFTQTKAQKKEATEAEMAFLQEVLGINETPVPSKTTNKSSKNKYPVIETDELLDVQKHGRKVADDSFRPEGGWRDGFVYETFSDELSLKEFNLFNEYKLHPLEAVALKKRGLIPDEVLAKHCVKNALFHCDQFQLDAQISEMESGLSFSEDPEDRVSKSNRNRLAALRFMDTRTSEEQREFEYLVNEEQKYKEKLNSEEKEEEPITCFKGYWEGRYHLNNHYKDEGGIHVYYDGSGIFCGLHIGIEGKPDPIVGITPHENFRVIKALKFIDIKLCNGVLSMKKKVRDYWMPILSGDGKHTLFATALKMLDIPRAKTISIDGNTAWAGIPKLDWFSPELQAVDPMDLLAILPEAEAKTLMLHLGKMATGFSTLVQGEKISPVIELELSYVYRMLPIICGAPKTGKSTLIEFLAYAINKVGFSSDVLGQTFNQFAWNGVTKNLLYIDDMTPQSMKSLLSCPEIKTIASNGKGSTQKKGQDEVNRHAQCSLLLACNEVALPKYLDPGVIDRMHVLQTYTKTQMFAKSQKKGKNMLTREHWEGLARELNVDIEALTLLLMRRSLDMFLDAVDVSKNEDGEWVQGIDKSKIVGILEGYRAEFQYKLPIEMVSNLTVSSRKCLILSQLLDKNLILPESFDDSFNAFTLLHTSKILCALDKNKKSLIEREIPNHIATYESDPDLINDKIREKKAKLDLSLDVLKAIETWVGCGIQQHILRQYKTAWNAKLNSSPDNDLILGGKSGQDFEGIWKKMIETVTTSTGLPVEQERYKYATAFESARKDSEGYVIQLEEMLQPIFEKYRGVLPDESLTWDGIAETASLVNLNLQITTFEYED
jgi:hypothetical protein